MIASGTVLPSLSPLHLSSGQTTRERTIPTNENIHPRSIGSSNRSPAISRSTLFSLQIVQVADMPSLVSFEEDRTGKTCCFTQVLARVYLHLKGLVTSQQTLSNTHRPRTPDARMNSRLIQGVGELDRCTGAIESESSAHVRANGQVEERPYLLVDLRDQDEFTANHVVSGNHSFPFRVKLLMHLPTGSSLAHHYPSAMLSRCTNNESKELLIYVNHPCTCIPRFHHPALTDSRTAHNLSEEE